MIPFILKFLIIVVISIFDYHRIKELLVLNSYKEYVKHIFNNTLNALFYIAIILATFVF